MELEGYLEGIGSCPQEVGKMLTPQRDYSRLYTDYGVYDNWAILLRADPKFVVQSLKELDFIFDREVKDYDYFHLEGAYSHGCIEIQVDSQPDGATTETASKEHSERQLRDYNMGLMLHPYQEKEIPGLNYDEALVEVIMRIGRWAIKNKVPLCFPDSIPGKEGYQAVDKIVYYNP